MTADEIQPFQAPPVPQPRRQLSRAEAVSFKDLKSLMSEAFKEVDMDTTHVPDGLCARTDQPALDRTASERSTERTPAGGSPMAGRSFQLPHSATTSYNRTLGRQASERLRRELLEVQAQPVLPLSSRTAARLERQCERGVEFLQQLQRPAYSRTAEEPAPVMPKTALRYSKGLAFMWQTKVGLGAGMTWGSGFVIARLGPGVWSAPCFLRDKFFSLGLTAGGMTTATCFAVPTDVGLQHFKDDELGASLDVALTMGVDPYEGDTPVPVRVAAVAERAAAIERVQDRVKSYKACDGVIVDVSWRCGIHAVDWGTNRALYGNGATPAGILDGKVQVPAQFRPLYDAIERLTQEAAGPKATASQFELEKARVRAASMSRQTSIIRRLRHTSSGAATSASGSTDGGLTRRSAEEHAETSWSSATVPTPPEVASPNDSFKLFSDAPLLDIDLSDDDEPLETITEREPTEILTVDAAA